MSRHVTRVSLLTTLLLTAACTQPAANVELKGMSTYSRNGTSSYAYNNAAPGSPSYQAAQFNNLAPSAGSSMNQSTEQTAAVQSIGVSDLAPPTQSTPSPKPPKPQASAAPINHWTGKPHETDESFNLQPQGKQASHEPMISEVTLSPKPKEESVAQLDRVISNDGEKPAAHAAKPAKVAASSGFMWPVSSHKVISGFGPKGGGKVNDGINIASGEGEPVWASADGEVVYVGNELQGYGNMILIKHAGDKTSSYAHLSRTAVDKYERVKQGDIIGYVGATGNAKEPQLHFAIRDGKDPVDPRKYLNRNVASN